MKYAIVESGGKQFRAVEGSMIEVDHLQIEVGEQVILENVLLVAEEDKFQVGTPKVKGANVKTTVAGHIKGPKLTIFHYRPKKRIRVKTGHRQQYTRLKIETINVE